MKRLIYLLMILTVSVASCKKPTKNEETIPYHLNFVILGKDGQNIIKKLNDTLLVNYVLNGQAQSSRLTIFKVEVSATDTASVTAYNGFDISDIDRARQLQGYITDASAAGTRNFSIYLNGASIGTIYYDYYGNLALSNPTDLSSTFTFNGTPVASGYLIGVFNDGSGITANIEYNTAPPGQPIAVMQLQ